MFHSWRIVLIKFEMVNLSLECRVRFDGALVTINRAMLHLHVRFLAFGRGARFWVELAIALALQVPSGSARV